MTARRPHTEHRRETAADLVARVERGEKGQSVPFALHSDRCGVHVWWSEPALAALEDVLRHPGRGRWLEVAAGDGRLTRMLSARGIPIRATDLVAADGVQAYDVTRYPAVPPPERVDGVLAVFPPDDAGVGRDLRAMAATLPLVVVVARLDGRLTLDVDRWGEAGLAVTPLPTVERELVCKHDYCQVPGDPTTVVRHARALLVTPGRQIPGPTQRPFDAASFLRLP